VLVKKKRVGHRTKCTNRYPEKGRGRERGKLLFILKRREEKGRKYIWGRITCQVREGGKILSGRFGKNQKN